MIQAFTEAFTSVWVVIGYIAGGTAAVLLAGVTALACIALAGMVFDGITKWLGSRWMRRGRRPRSRIGRIILSHAEGNTDGI